MNTTNIQLCYETEQKMREFIPFIHSDEDMIWITDWFLTMGIALVELSLKKHPHLSVGDLIRMSMKEKPTFN